MKKIEFAVLTKTQEFVLKSIKPERRFVTGETVEVIKDCFDLVNLENEDLVPLRNTFVKFYEKDGQSRLSEDDRIRVSMLVSIIDNELFKRGLLF